MSGRLGALLALAITAAGCMPPEEQSSVPAAEPQASVTSSLELGTSFSESAFLEACEDWDEWDKPAPPFQLLGDTWYVGTCGISAILIIGEDEHVLIDSGVDAAVPLVLDNIRALGLDPRDVGHLLMSHEHFDHVGGHGGAVGSDGRKGDRIARSGNGAGERNGVPGRSAVGYPSCDDAGEGRQDCYRWRCPADR